MIYVGIENVHKKCEDLTSELPKSQTEHINKNHRLALARTAAACALHKLIKAHAPELIPYEIAYTEQGRPYILGAKNLDISISHAGEEYAAAALCIGESARVGIDMEEIKKANLRIAKKYFSKEENEHLSSLQKKDAAAEFTKLWTKYESKAKYLGGGLADMRKGSQAYVYTTVFDGNLGGKYALSVASKEKEEIEIIEF